jgi:hypothetical protein
VARAVDASGSCRICDRMIAGSAAIDSLKGLTAINAAMSAIGMPDCVQLIAANAKQNPRFASRSLFELVTSSRPWRKPVRQNVLVAGPRLTESKFLFPEEG